MRNLLRVLICLVFVSCGTTRQPTVKSVEIKEVKPRYMQTEDFMRITEYLTGAEHQGRRVIMRSDIDSRDGYYFTLVFNESVRRLPKGTTILGEFHTPAQLDVKRYIFEMPSRRPNTKEVFVGLTGEDWTHGDTPPGAWRFTVLHANENELGVLQSYLWSM